VEKSLSPRHGLKPLKNGNAMTAFHARFAVKAGANFANLKSHAKKRPKAKCVRREGNAYRIKNHKPLIEDPGFKQPG